MRGVKCEICTGGGGCVSCQNVKDALKNEEEEEK